MKVDLNPFLTSFLYLIEFCLINASFCIARTAAALSVSFSSLLRSFQFTKREPEDTKSADSDRDIFNEKPSKEEVMAATQAEGPKRISDSAIIHTTMGDIHIKLFPVEYVACGEATPVSH